MRQCILLCSCLWSLSSVSYFSRIWWRAIRYLTLSGIISPPLVEIAFFLLYSSLPLLCKLELANYRIRLRKSSTHFRTFFISSSVEYAVLGIRWVLITLSSQNHPLLLIGAYLGSFLVATCAFSAMIVGIGSERLQILLLEVRASRIWIEDKQLTRYRHSYSWRHYLFASPKF